MKRALDVLNDKVDMDITLGYPLLIKDNLSENFNDVNKVTNKKRKKKLSITMGGNLVSVSKYYHELEG